MYPLENQSQQNIRGTWITPDIDILYRRGNRHNNSNSYLAIVVRHTEVDRPLAESEDAMEDCPGTEDLFHAMSNWGNKNKNGTTYDMSWAAIGQEELQYQLNDYDKSDISEIDILSHY